MCKKQNKAHVQSLGVNMISDIKNRSPSKCYIRLLFVASNPREMPKTEVVYFVKSRSRQKARPPF